MDADSISEFNQLKAAALIASYPVTVEFTSRKGTSYACAFGEHRNDGQLHESGQGVVNNRVGALYWPVAASHDPRLYETFRITACAQRPALVGTLWKIHDLAAAAHEVHSKLTCTQVNS
jgi:hypothetical protein